MKVSTSIARMFLVLGIAASAIAASSAFAQGTPSAAGARMEGAPGSRPARPTLDAMFDRIDTNKDGQISREEFKAAHDKRKEHRGRRAAKTN